MNIDQRKHTRLPVSPDFHVQVRFSEPELATAMAQIAVKNICTRGLALKVPLGLRPLEVSMPINSMAVTLPGDKKVVLSGKVLYKRFGQCGIAFTDSNPAELQKLDKYMKVLQV